ncbi:MAG: hypothetical protein ACI8QZ_002096 [Chlamydiales bacterium]|jgi:hypothetical protein
MNPTLCLLTLAALVPGAPSAPGGLLAIRVDRAETVANGTMEHAVILIEDGKIVMIGEDLPIERGIPVLDLPAGWTVLPGLVNCYSRVGMDGKGPSDAQPQLLASDTLYPASEAYPEVLEAGITTLGQYPPGDGIPGQAVAVRPLGDTPESMIVADSVYLKVILRSSKASKKRIRSGFEKLDEYLEKEAENREKWEEAVEKAKKKKSKKSKKKKDDDDDDDEKDSDDEKEKDEDKPADEDKDKDEDKDALDVYEPLELKPEIQAFMNLRDGSLDALVSISKSADYLHFLDALGDEEIDWSLRIPLTRDIDIFLVADKIGEAGCRVVVEPTMTLQPGTMRQRNLAAELSRAGAKLVLVPRSDSLDAHKAWLRHTGEMITAGLDRDTALRAMTLEPAELMGVADRIGSLEEGKDANLLFMNGDPFEAGASIEAVMLEGDFVFGEVNQ